jgi:DNA-binding NtrC family response regulator
MTGDQPTVLIVDDSEGVCLAVSMMLEKHGFKTQTAHDSKGALSLADAHTFDIILIDRILGRESGLDLAEHLLVSAPKSRIIIMSGSVTIRVEMEAHPQLRRLALLQKPFTRQELLDCLHAVLDNAA